MKPMRNRQSKRDEDCHYVQSERLRAMTPNMQHFLKIDFIQIVLL